MPQWTPNRKIVFTIGLIALAATAFWSTFGSASICTTCGRIQHTTAWQLPLLPATYWSSQSEIDSPISVVVAKHGLASVSTHAWLFAAGSGNGIVCGIGEGRHLQVSRPEVAAALDGIATYQGKPAAQKWLTRLLDPKVSGLVAGQFASAPAGGFADRNQFEKWWGQIERCLNLELDPPAEVAPP